MFLLLYFPPCGGPAISVIREVPTVLCPVCLLHPGEEVHPHGVGRLGFEADTLLDSLQDTEQSLNLSELSSFKLNR